MTKQIEDDFGTWAARFANRDFDTGTCLEDSVAWSWDRRKDFAFPGVDPIIAAQHSHRVLADPFAIQALRRGLHTTGFELSPRRLRHARLTHIWSELRWTGALATTGISAERLPAGADSAVEKRAEEQPPAGLQGDQPPLVVDTEWIELVLVDTLGNPVAFEPYRVQLSDGTIREGRLGKDGKGRLDGIPPGTCEVSFPELDTTEWRRD